MAEVLKVAAGKVRQFMEQIDQQQQAFNSQSNRFKEDNPGSRKLSLVVNQSIAEKTGLTEREEAVETSHDLVGIL